MNGFTDVRIWLKDDRLTAAAGKVRPASLALRGWALWRHRWETRRLLLELTDAELADVGLSRGQQWEEGTKPFWRE
ncbi:DUF1127 domain-containing protein [Pseudomonas sp. DC3000-4b1]|uniref:DUF1127 domain-containing protein n=1 Tax=unclassified Pseudomonas TaxID=196821 RepID=UPI003CE90373